MRRRSIAVAAAVAAVALAGCGADGSNGADDAAPLFAPAPARADEIVSAAREHARATASWRRTLATAARCERQAGGDERDRCWGPDATESGEALLGLLDGAHVAAPVGPCRPALLRVRSAAVAVRAQLVIVELLGRHVPAGVDSLVQARRAAEQRLDRYEAAWAAMDEACS